MKEMSVGKCPRGKCLWGNCPGGGGACPSVNDQGDMSEGKIV